MGMDVTEGGRSNSLTVAIRGSQGKRMAAMSESLFQPAWEGTVSERRSIDAWVVEGT